MQLPGLGRTCRVAAAIPCFFAGVPASSLGRDGGGPLGGTRCGAGSLRALLSEGEAQESFTPDCRGAFPTYDCVVSAAPISDEAQLAIERKARCLASVESYESAVDMRRTYVSSWTGREPPCRVLIGMAADYRKLDRPVDAVEILEVVAKAQSEFWSSYAQRELRDMRREPSGRFPWHLGSTARYAIRWHLLGLDGGSGAGVLVTKLLQRWWHDTWVLL